MSPADDRVTVPRLDIGIVTWNTGELTASAIERLETLRRGQPWRLLVQDNSSSDDTVALVRAVAPDADIGVNEQNIGFGAAMNQLLARGTAPWFLCLNSDAWPEPGAIEALLDAGDADVRRGLVVPRLERPDGPLEHSTYPFPSLRVAAAMAVGLPRWAPAPGKRWLLPGAWSHDEPRSVPWAVGAAWLMRRAAVDAVGGFDESFHMYAEDLEWCQRLRRGGWDIWFEPAAIVRHLGSASCDQAFGPAKTRQQLDRTYEWLARDHGRLWLLVHRWVSVAGARREARRAARQGRLGEAAALRELARAHRGGPA